MGSEGREQVPSQSDAGAVLTKDRPRGWTLPFGVLAWSFAQAACLVALAFLVALLVNWARGHGGLLLRRRAPFDLYTDCPEVRDDLPMVTVQQLGVRPRSVVFVDGRMAPAYCRGHVQGALFLPAYETEAPDPVVVAHLSKQRGKWIVVYGDRKLQGGKRLATSLANAHVRGIHVLSGGYEAWEKAKRPIARCAISQMTVASVKARQAAEIVLVDARPEDAFSKGHIPGAVNLPFDDVLAPDPKVVARLIADHRSIVVYEAGKGVEALAVAAELKARGARTVSVLSGGWAAWKALQSGPSSRVGNTDRAASGTGLNDNGQKSGDEVGR